MTRPVKEMPDIVRLVPSRGADGFRPAGPGDGRARAYVDAALYRRMTDRLDGLAKVFLLANRALLELDRAQEEPRWPPGWDAENHPDLIDARAEVACARAVLESPSPTTHNKENPNERRNNPDA